MTTPLQIGKVTFGPAVEQSKSFKVLPVIPPPSAYPANWQEIATRIKTAAGWICERCKHANDFKTGHVLTVHHLDGNKANCEDWNLAALCQRCHLKIQGRVRMDQMFFLEILDVAEWFKPHLKGYLESRGAAQ